MDHAPSDLSAYVNSEVDFDNRLIQYQPLNTSDTTVHFLQIFFRHLPTKGQFNLAEDIVGCGTDDLLRQLVLSLKTGLLRPLKAEGGKTPVTPSPRIGLDDSIEEPDAMDLSPATRDQRRLSDNCMRRDGNKCVISGLYHPGHRPPGGRTSRLNATHILPFSLGTFSGREDRHEVSLIWNNLYRFFPALQQRVGLRPDDINRIDNVMMLTSPLHDSFGAFEFSLKETDVVNSYQIKVYPTFTDGHEYLLPHDKHMQFVAHDGRFALPNPIFLAVHAAIAKILHATGMAEIIDRDIRDLGDSSGNLLPDGTTDISRLLSVSRLSLLATNTNQKPDQPSNEESEEKKQILRDYTGQVFSGQELPTRSKENRHSY